MRRPRLSRWPFRNGSDLGGLRGRVADFAAEPLAQQGEQRGLFRLEIGKILQFRASRLRRAPSRASSRRDRIRDDLRMDIAFATDRRRVAEPRRDAFDRGSSRCASRAPDCRRSRIQRVMAASTVPAHVRKSFAVIVAPEISRRYSLTSADVTACRSPSSSTYWKRCCPGRS